MEPLCSYPPESVIAGSLDGNWCITAILLESDGILRIEEHRRVDGEIFGYLIMDIEPRWMQNIAYMYARGSLPEQLGDIAKKMMRWCFEHGRPGERQDVASQP